MPLLVNMKPKNFMNSTPKEHFSGFNFSLNFCNVSKMSMSCQSLSIELTSPIGRTTHNPSSAKASKAQTLKSWMYLPLIHPQVMSWPPREGGWFTPVCCFNYAVFVQMVHITRNNSQRSHIIVESSPSLRSMKKMLTCVCIPLWFLVFSSLVIPSMPPMFLFLFSLILLVFKVSIWSLTLLYGFFSYV